MIVIYLSLHSQYEYSVTIPRTTLSSSPPPQEGEKNPFSNSCETICFEILKEGLRHGDNRQQTHFGVRD